MLNNTLVKTIEAKTKAWEEIANAITDVFCKTVNASELSSELLFNESDKVDMLSEADKLFEALSKTVFKKSVLILLEKVKIIKRNATVEMETAINDNKAMEKILIATEVKATEVKAKLHASKAKFHALKNAFLNASTSDILKMNKDKLEKATRDYYNEEANAETMCKEWIDIEKLHDASKAKKKATEATTTAWKAVLNGVSDVLSKIIKTEVISLTAKNAATKLAILNASTKTDAAEKIALLSKVYTTKKILANAEELSKFEAIINEASSIKKMILVKATLEAKELKLLSYWYAPTWKEWKNKEENVYVNASLNACLTVEKLLDSETDALFKAKQLMKTETKAEGEKIIEIWGLGIDMDWDEVMCVYYNIYAL